MKLVKLVRDSAKDSFGISFTSESPIVTEHVPDDIIGLCTGDCVIGANGKKCANLKVLQKIVKGLTTIFLVIGRPQILQ